MAHDELLGVRVRLVEQAAKVQVAALKGQAQAHVQRDVRLVVVKVELPVLARPVLDLPPPNFGPPSSARLRAGGGL